MEYQYNTISPDINNSKYVQGQGQYINERILMDDTEWNQNRYMLRQIIQNNIHKKRLIHKQDDIFRSLDNIIKNMKPQLYLFSNKTELNKAILNEIGLYITEIVTNENVKHQSSYLREDIKNDNNERFMNDFSNKKNEFESYHKTKPPKPIQFEDDTTLENNNIEDMLKKEIAEREQFDNSIIDNPGISTKILSNETPSNTPFSSDINNIEYQVIETPVFSLSSINKTNETSKKIKSQSPKQLKSILKTSSKQLQIENAYSSLYTHTKWFINVPAIYTSVKIDTSNNQYEDKNKEHKEYKEQNDFSILINDKPFLSFINYNKDKLILLSIEQICIVLDKELKDLRQHSLIYMYCFIDEEYRHPYISSILFMESIPVSSSRCYQLYKGNSPVNNYDDNKDSNNKNKDITNIIFTTIPYDSKEWNFNFSLFPTIPEMKKREKKKCKLSIQLKF